MFCCVEQLLNTYKKAIGKKRHQVGDLKDKLQNGLNKLDETSKEVAELQQQIKDLQPVLKKTQIEVDAKIKVITKEKEEANALKKQVTTKQEQAELQVRAESWTSTSHHSKRSAALSSWHSGLCFGYAMEPSPLRTMSKAGCPHSSQERPNTAHFE